MAKLPAVPQSAVNPDQMAMRAEMMFTRFNRSAKRAIGMPRKV